jgi:hypothetical protein
VNRRNVTNEVDKNFSACKQFFRTEIRNCWKFFLMFLKADGARSLKYAVENHHGMPIGLSGIDSSKLNMA